MPHAPNILERRPAGPPRLVEIVPGLGLLPGRAHELCGASRRMLALILAAQTAGPVFWIRQSWRGEHLFPEGIAPLMNPGRLVMVDATRDDDLLWVAEECLRSGVAPLVVAELPAPLRLTPVRRLHLAAEAGAEKARPAPMGLLLLPGDGGSQGVESRWQLVPAPGWARGEGAAWTLTRLRARMEPPGSWRLVRGSGFRVRLAPPDLPPGLPPDFPPGLPPDLPPAPQAWRLAGATQTS